MASSVYAGHIGVRERGRDWLTVIQCPQHAVLIG